MNISLCVCVCVCERERESERERVGMDACVYGCMYDRVCLCVRLWKTKAEADSNNLV